MAGHSGKVRVGMMSVRSALALQLLFQCLQLLHCWGDTRGSAIGPDSSGWCAGWCARAATCPGAVLGAHKSVGCLSGGWLGCTGGAADGARGFDGITVTGIDASQLQGRQTQDLATLPLGRLVL